MARNTARGDHPRPRPRTLLLGTGADPQQAALAKSEGADLVDVGAATPDALAVIRASLPAAVLWTGPADVPLDLDRLAAAAGPTTGGPPAAVIATAAVCTWLGAPVVRSRHTRAVRRAIDMTASIAGSRLPSRTVRGLA